MHSPIRATLRAALYGVWTLLLLPVQMLAVTLRLPLAKRLPRFYHRTCCRILGIDVRHQGEPSRDHPVLFVANHASYLDIAILGSLIAGSFVAKAEIADWPFFGLLAKLQRTVFIDRRGSKAALHRDEIGARLEAGDDLILFPEGTSSDGNRVLPFKSALFSVAERRVQGRPLVVQPVSVAYTHIDGLPIGREWRPYFAWYGGMDLGAHIRHVIALGRLTIQVTFHPPLGMAEIEAARSTPSVLRKLMADRSHAAVAEGHAQALFATGRRALTVPTSARARSRAVTTPAGAAGEPTPRVT
jgi:1-acyl-sn-glycerol-3-phosphate acyltransferase